MPNHWVSQGMDGKWIHRLEGSERPIGVYESQQDAWEAAKQAARLDRAEAFLQGENGKIRARSIYGRDSRHM